MCELPTVQYIYIMYIILTAIGYSSSALTTGSSDGVDPEV